MKNGLISLGGVKSCFLVSFVTILVLWIISHNAFQHHMVTDHSRQRFHFIRPTPQSDSTPNVPVDIHKGDYVRTQRNPPEVTSQHAFQSKLAVQSLDHHPIRIAYIFAGSVRSFVCPKVHWSLRLNVIDAFGGEPYVFVRLSEEDNKNTKTGKGAIWKPKHGSIISIEVNETLKILNPRKVQYFRLSEQEEEMKRNYPETIHRVFRENDLRRYSMFYHRCMGYRLAREWEEEHGIRFDWVALIRLDAAWLEPVLPIQYYANDRVWLTETGFAPFNDQFMLIPRQYSDYLYDLNTKVRKEVYCLGGPDIEPWKCNATELERKRRSKQFINETLSFCCSDVAQHNMMGYSEAIHFRHLEEGKIPVSLARFTVYLVRYTRRKTCYGDCVRLAFCFRMFQEDHRGGYPYWRNGSTEDVILDSRFLSLSTTDGARCSFVNHRSLSPWSPINATELHRLVSLNQTPALDYQENLCKQVGQLHPSLFNNPWRFTNWRLRSSLHIDDCLSFDFKNKSLYWGWCQDHPFTHLGSRHLSTQTFFLLARLPLDMKNRVSYNIVNDFVRDEDEIFHYERLPLPNHMRIFIHDRTPPPYHEMMFDFFCLTIIVPVNASNIEIDRILTRKGGLPVEAIKCAEKDDNPYQWFKTINSTIMGSKPQLIQSDIESIAFPGYCLTVVVDFNNRITSQINFHHFHHNYFATSKFDEINDGEGSGIKLIDCRNREFNRQRLFEIELLKS